MPKASRHIKVTLGSKPGKGVVVGTDPVGNQITAADGDVFTVPSAECSERAARILVGQGSAVWFTPAPEPAKPARKKAARKGD